MFSLALFAGSCNLAHQPIFLEHRRPANVPDKAVLVPGPKGGWWQNCNPPIEPSVEVTCTIFNWGGDMLYSEMFVATDGKQIDRRDVEIDSAAKLVGSSWINLKAGRVLVPRSRAEELRRFLAGPDAK